MSATLDVGTIDALHAAERFRDVRARLAEADLDDGAPGWRLAVRAARADLADPSRSVDEALLDLADLLVDPLQVPEDLPLAHALVIRGYAIKRLFSLAEDAIAAARTAVGEHPLLWLEEGRAMMAFDERERAREAFERALAAGGAHADEARLALADALYVLGDFDGCLALLDAIEGDAVRPRALRLAASCHAARRDHEGEARAWAEVLARLPEGDHAQGDRVSLALALGSCGRRAEALEELGRAWRENPASGHGHYARSRMHYLERHLDGGRAVRLAAFPTTAQKWNYCGPAVLELCLRYLDVELTQDEIADTVKRTTGTPMYEIAAFLDAHRITARRIEATRERVMAALDLGLPVIVQEEYSTTSHVAVIVGYDEALGTFIAQDPATHRPLLKTFEFTERAGDLYGNGAIVVLGRAGPELEARERACDEAGLLHAPHLALLDDADRLRPAATSAEREEATLWEVLRRCDDALALAPRFKLAWHRKVDALSRRWGLSGRDEHREEALRALYHVRVAFARDEWPHQLHAHLMMDRGLYDEAYAEYHEASRVDPGDANNRAAMGECMWLGGDLERAERHLVEALALAPHVVRTAENLAAVYVRERIERERQARRTVESHLAPFQIFERVPHADAELDRRAAHFVRVALAGNPRNPFNHGLAGDLAAMRGDFEAAAAAYAESIAIDPARAGSALGYAVALRALGRAQDAALVLEPLTQEARPPTRAFTLYAELLEELGRPEEAASALVEALVSGADAPSLARALFTTLRRASSGEAAAARLRELVEERADPQVARAVAEVLDDEQQRGHAIALLRRVVHEAPGDVDAVYRLGRLLTGDVLTRAEGEALLERVIELAPAFAGARTRLAWSLCETDPARGLSLLDALPDQQDAYVLETRAALLAARGEGEASAAALERALDVFGDRERGLIALTEWHVDDRRYDRALSLARTIPERVTRDALRLEAERAWLEAFQLGGAIRDALPRLRELSREAVPPHLAWSTYWGVRSLEPALAADAADALARTARENMVATWRLRAAGARAKTGAHADLDAVRDTLGDDPELWAQLAYAYEAVHRYDDANAAAERALALDDTHMEALGAMEGAYVRRGDVAAAIRCAERLVELYPYEHIGPERLGTILALSLDAERALPLTHRAVDAAPFCHNAHWSRAAALFAAGDLAGAERHVERTLALDPPTEEIDAIDALAMRYALAGDAARLEACLERLHRARPAALFAGFDDALRELARRRA
ncbi:MAG: tetratricopeptide repeat protein [Sandaracinaceae bacterium]|nr:tetratricopeptide repeat protein [Sandaracinaceae bacterium]